MPRPIRATISASALAHNFMVAKAYAGGAKLWAVLKANAYGHGVERARLAYATGTGDGDAQSSRSDRPVDDAAMTGAIVWIANREEYAAAYPEVIDDVVVDAVRRAEPFHGAPVPKWGWGEVGGPYRPEQ